MSKLKNILKIILLFIFFSISINTSFANQVDFYGERKSNWNINTLELNNDLERFYKKTGLNTDIIILGKNATCYLENNFDSCIQKNKNYSSDLLIVLSMKSDIKSRGDIRSLIKDEFKESITPRELKNLQDGIISYFKRGDYDGGLSNYLDNLKKLIEDKCKKVGISKNCDAVILAKNYHSYITNLEKQKKESARKKMFYYIGLLFSFILSFFGFRKYYINNLNNLSKDINYLYMQIDSEKEIFVKDKENLKKHIKWLLEKIKTKLGDLDKSPFTLKKFYNDKKEEFILFQKKFEEYKKYYSTQEELKDKMDKLKKINL